MIACDWCGGTGRGVPEYEPETGFVDAPCLKCRWPRRVVLPLPAPLENFGMPDHIRVLLEIEDIWFQHGPAWE